MDRIKEIIFSKTGIAILFVLVAWGSIFLPWNRLDALFLNKFFDTPWPGRIEHAIDGMIAFGQSVTGGYNQGLANPFFSSFRSIMGLIAAVFTYIWMQRVKSHIPVGQVVEESLTGREKVWVLVLCLASPILAGAILYYGWRKVLPQKAKLANRISWIALAVLIAVSFAFYGIPRVEALGGKLKSEHE